MTAAREALVLPALFLTVVLVGGLRPGTGVLLPPPSIFALVLAVLLVGALVQSRACDPAALVNGGRSALANANGVTVLATLFLAAAQVFALLTPASGLPRLILSVYFFVLMLNTLAAGPDRVRVLRSLGVTFTAAFVLKYVILAALSDPARSRLGRVLQLMVEGVTLGSVTQDAQRAVSGYLAFATVAVFLVGIWMLPRPQAVHGRSLPDTTRRAIDR
jgi:hypothetical protein